MTTIYVTQEDINNGIKKNCKKCPIALAVTRALIGYVRAEIGISSVFIISRELPSKRITLPDLAWQFIKRYDDNGVVEPFTFELDIPQEFLNANAN